MSTREACAVLKLGQQRVSQLCAAGDLAHVKDEDGKLQIDRESVESLVVERMTRKARSQQEKEEKRALAEENRDRLRRQRTLEKMRERERVTKLDELQERGVLALERIAKHLDQRK